MIALTIYSRPGCHLCDEMKSVVERVARRIPVTIEEIDISGDERLEAQYGVESPVLLVNGKKAAKYRVSEWELIRLVTARSGGSGESGGP